MKFKIGQIIYMRRLFWLVFLIGAYLWVLTSGHDVFILARVKAVYGTISDWIAGAEADFHLKSEKSKKKHRRWE
jgi:hypothetical protein